MTPQDRLNAIQARLDAASPRLWTALADFCQEANARLVEHVPADLEALLAVARAAVAYVQHDSQAPTTPNLLPGDLYAALEQAVEALGDSS